MEAQRGEVFAFWTNTMEHKESGINAPSPHLPPHQMAMAKRSQERLLTLEISLHACPEAWQLGDSSTRSALEQPLRAQVSSGYKGCSLIHQIPSGICPGGNLACASKEAYEQCTAMLLVMQAHEKHGKGPSAGGW